MNGERKTGGDIEQTEANERCDGDGRLAQRREIIRAEQVVEVQQNERTTDERERPDARADRDRSERVGVEVPGEQRVDEVHADRRQLAEHERHRETQRVFQLARETRLVAM